MRIGKKIAGVLLFLLLLSLFSSTALANDEPPTGAGPKGQNVIMDDRAIGTESPASMESPGAAGAEKPQTNPASTGGSSADVQSQTPETNGAASGANAQNGGQPAPTAKPASPAASTSQTGTIRSESEEKPNPTGPVNEAPSPSAASDAAQKADADSTDNALAASEPAASGRQLVLWALLALLLLLAAGRLVRKRRRS